ncbi:MAG TPA: protein-disulfide reductase DsbD domain-containing protein [Candidatus Dormibacteraeota bacterium]|nr:protein-disulfide reductase DsbD domain-containing protein [Candidatus Dormibacteraeota bacterium]
MAAVMAAATLLVPAAGAQMDSNTARTVVSTQVYVSLEPVPRGRTFDVAVIAHIKPTFHINAHKVLDQFLIPTKLEGHFPAGFRLASTGYPPGELRKFSFSPKKLAVYTGQMIVRMKIKAASGAPLGPSDLPLSLHYQACNDTYCLPPVTVPVSVHLTVARAGSAAKAAHPEIFRR